VVREQCNHPNHPTRSFAMNTNEIVAKILSCSWPSQEDLVAFAVKRHGFGGDDGYYGITYPCDLDDHDRASGHTIPNGMIEVSYRDGEVKDALIAEKEYLILLAVHLEKLNLHQLARKIHNLINSCSSHSTEYSSHSLYSAGQLGTSR